MELSIGCIQVRIELHFLSHYSGWRIWLICDTYLSSFILELVLARRMWHMYSYTIVRGILDLSRISMASFLYSKVVSIRSIHCIILGIS